jgi:hypothetical protein
MRVFGRIGIAWFVATIVAVTIAAAAVGSVRSEVTDVPTALGVSVSPAVTVVESANLGEDPDDGSHLERTSTSTTAPAGEATTSDRPSNETTTTSTSGATEQSQIVYTETPTRQEEATKSLPQGGSTSSATTVHEDTTTTSTTRPPRVSQDTTTSTTVQATTTSSTTTTAPATTTTTTTRPRDTAYTRVIETDGGSLSIRVDGDTVIFRRAYPNNGWRFDLVNGGPDKVEARFGRLDDRASRIRVVVTAHDGVLDTSIASSN